MKKINGNISKELQSLEIVMVKNTNDNSNKLNITTENYDNTLTESNCCITVYISGHIGALPPILMYGFSIASVRSKFEIRTSQRA